MKPQTSPPSKPSPWQQFFGSLTSTAKQRLEAAKAQVRATPLAQPVRSLVGEEHDDFATFRASLTGTARSQLENLADGAVEEVPVPDERAARYCLIECPSGEWPQTRIFSSPEGLAQRMARLEKEDVCVIPFYGIPLRFTKRPQRYLELPDGRGAIVVPPFPNGPTPIVDADLIDHYQQQEDGFLGPDALASGWLPALPSPKPTVNRPATEPVEDSDDDPERPDDDDDEEQGDPVSGD